VVEGGAAWLSTQGLPEGETPVFQGGVIITEVRYRACTAAVPVIYVTVRISVATWVCLRRAAS
jgi:hypothetical protein